MKLYRIKLKGMYGTYSGTAYGNPFVVADNTTEALNKVQEYLEKRDIGFSYERELDTIELLAEVGDYPKCKIQLFL
jgi:hypothetical protein